MKLSTHNLTVKMADKLICAGLNITINSHEIWGILGPNGSGKTTLLNTLAGLHTPSFGEVHLEGENIYTLKAKKISQHLAVLFQEMHFAFSQTVWDFCLAARYPHLGYFNKANEHDKSVVRQALLQMGLLEYKHRTITRLSGGEKRRLAIASTLAQTPEIYLLDEPTNHLDLSFQGMTLRHFQHLAINTAKAVVMSMHDINLAQQFCTNILLLFPNKPPLYGRKDDMLTKENLTTLYQHSIRKLMIDETIVWQI